MRKVALGVVVASIGLVGLVAFVGCGSSNSDTPGGDPSGGGGADGGASGDGSVGVDGGPGGSTPTGGGTSAFCTPYGGKTVGDVATATLGLKAGEWTEIGAPPEPKVLSPMPQGGRAKLGLVTLTECGVVALGEDDGDANFFIAPPGEVFRKMSTKTNVTNGSSFRRLSLVGGSLVFLAHGNSTNQENLWRMPFGGGEVTMVTAPDAPSLQVFGWAAFGDTMYFTSRYTTKYEGLNAAPVSGIDNGSIVPSQTKIRPVSQTQSTATYKFGDKVVVNGKIIDPATSCTTNCNDPGLPSDNVAPDQLFPTAEGDAFIGSTYDPAKLATLKAGDTKWTVLSTPTYATINASAARGGKDLASVATTRGGPSKIVFLSGVGTSAFAATDAPSLGLNGWTYTDVYTNGTIALVYATNSGSSARARVYGIVLP